MTLGSGLFAKALAVFSHLTRPGGGLSGEIYDLRKDIARTLAFLNAGTVEEFTNPVAASGNTIKLAIASATTVVVYKRADFDGGITALPYARNLTVTTAGGTAADVPANVVVTGLYRGKPQTETITISQTAATATGLKPFDLNAAGLAALKYTLPAGEGTGGTLAFGIGAGIGVGATPKSRAGGVILDSESADGTRVTTGALTAAGLYTPATAPNGTHDYAIKYEFTPDLDILS